MLKLEDFSFGDYDKAVGDQLCYSGKCQDYEIWQSASDDFCMSIKTYDKTTSYNVGSLSAAIRMIEEEESKQAE